MMEFYDLGVNKIDGEPIKMSQYKGKVVMIVNTASSCGFTPQFKELEELYKKYQDKGFTILGFPSNQFANQESGTNDEIQAFCQNNYGVTFPMFEKINVNGKNAHPVYKYLKKGSLLSKRIKWNFTKFLVDSNGAVFKRYGSGVVPFDIEKDIVSLLDHS